jgi:hypothetical protein
MPTLNFSVTQSIDTLAVNLSASEALVMNINNPLVGASYFGLETIPDNNGVYTSSSPKNTSGSFTLGTGIIGVVKDDYKMSAVVSPGNNVLTFSPAVAVTGSTLRTKGISSPPVSGYDADALAFFARVTTAGGTLSTTEMNATNQLIVDMKYYGLWDSMKAVYPMVGASAAACAQNLKSSSFTGMFSSGWTFASTGVTPNGTSAYFNTKLIPSTNISSASSNHISFYSRTNQSTAPNCEMGAFDTSTNTPIVMLAINSNASGAAKYELRHFCENGLFGLAPPASTLGFACNTKTTSGAVRGFWNNSLIGTATVTDALTNKEVYISARNSDGTADTFSVKQCAFASIGDGLTDTQAANFYTVVQAFQTTLGRQV